MGCEVPERENKSAFLCLERTSEDFRVHCIRRFRHVYNNDVHDIVFYIYVYVRPYEIKALREIGIMYQQAGRSGVRALLTWIFNACLSIRSLERSFSYFC